MLADRMVTDISSHENPKLDPSKNIEDEEEECTKRPRTNKLPKSHWDKADRIDRHDSKEIRRFNEKLGSKSLYALPSKVHNTTFGSLGDIDLSLSLVNRYFWAVDLAHIEDRIVSSSAPMSGERIICVSDHSDSSDFPPGLLSADEQADLAQLIRVHHIDTFAVDTVWKKTGSRSLSQILENKFKEWDAKYPMSEADRIEILMSLKSEMLEFLSA